MTGFSPIRPDQRRRAAAPTVSVMLVGLQVRDGLQVYLPETGRIDGIQRELPQGFLRADETIDEVVQRIRPSRLKNTGHVTSAGWDEPGDDVADASVRLVMLTLLPPTEDPNWIPVRSLTPQQGVSTRDLACIELASLALRRSLLLDAQTLRLVPRLARQWWSARTSGGEPFLRGLLPEVFTLREVENTLAAVLDPAEMTRADGLAKPRPNTFPMDRRNFRRTLESLDWLERCSDRQGPDGAELWRFSSRSATKSI